MRILALTWPVMGDGDLAIKKGTDRLIIPVDFLFKQLMLQGHEVVCVNAALEKYEFPRDGRVFVGSASRIPYVAFDQVRNLHFDAVWHAIRVPTPEPAIEIVTSMTCELNAQIPVWNNVKSCKTFTKRKYLSTFTKYGLAAEILENCESIENDSGKFDRKKCFPSYNGAFVAKDLNAIRVPMYNRGVGIGHRDGGITLRYYDNAGMIEEGYRTYFRVPFALGSILPGARYFCPENLYSPKGGGADWTTPYTLDGVIARDVSRALACLEIDIAHVEGLETPSDGVRFFDINPFPTSGGKTLGPMSSAIADCISQTGIA